MHDNLAVLPALDRVHLDLLRTLEVLHGYNRLVARPAKLPSPVRGTGSGRPDCISRSLWRRRGPDRTSLRQAPEHQVTKNLFKLETISPRCHHLRTAEPSNGARHQFTLARSVSTFRGICTDDHWLEKYPAHFGLLTLIRQYYVGTCAVFRGHHCTQLCPL